MEYEYQSEKEEPESSQYERALLVGLQHETDDESFARSMEELKNLAKACNMEPVGVATQKSDHVHKALYIGTGKAAEVREAAALLEANVVVFDDALTPSQLSNLQKELKKPVLDRTTLILDIFASRARTRERGRKKAGIRPQKNRKKDYRARAGFKRNRKRTAGAAQKAPAGKNPVSRAGRLYKRRQVYDFKCDGRPVCTR